MKKREYRKKNTPVVFGKDLHENKSKNGKQKMSSERVIYLTISRSNFDAQIAQLLYATGSIHDNEEVTSMKYTEFHDGDFLVTVVLKGEVKTNSLASS